MSDLNYGSRGHETGGCWPSQCQTCTIEADAPTAPLSGVYGLCTACNAVEVELVKATGTRDLSGIGEHHAYPTGYGCEACS